VATCLGSMFPSCSPVHLRQWWHICSGPLARVPRKCFHSHKPLRISPEAHRQEHVSDKRNFKWSYIPVFRSTICNLGHCYKTVLYFWKKLLPVLGMVKHHQTSTHFDNMKWLISNRYFGLFQNYCLANRFQFAGQLAGRQRLLNSILFWLTLKYVLMWTPILVNYSLENHWNFLLCKGFG
jgi:hypothetical protein